MVTTATPHEPAVIGQVSTLDRFLPARILAAIGVVRPLIADLATERR